MACPASTIDRQTPAGEQIPIEQRHADEVRYFGEHLVAEANTPVFNPAFDITPGELVTGIITDRGVMLPPYKSSLARVFPDGA